MNNNFWHGTTRSEDQQAGTGQQWKALLNFILSFIFQTILQNGVSYVQQTARGYTFLKANQETKTLGALVLVPCLFGVVLLVATFLVMLILFCLCIIAVLAACVFAFLLLSLLLRLLLTACSKLHKWWQGRQQKATPSGTASATGHKARTFASARTNTSTKPSDPHAGKQHRYKHTPPIPGRPKHRVHVPASGVT